MNFHIAKLLNFAEVVITRKAESQSAELCLQMVFACLSQARSQCRSNRGSWRRKFSALTSVAGDFVLFLRFPLFFLFKKSYTRRLKLNLLSKLPHKQTNERKRQVKKKKIKKIRQNRQTIKTGLHHQNVEEVVRELVNSTLIRLRI